MSEEIKGSNIYRYACYTKLAGITPSTGEVMDESGCSIKETYK